MSLLSASEISNILYEGASALRRFIPELNGAYWRLNPYPSDSERHDVWLDGYDEEIKRRFG